MESMAEYEESKNWGGLEQRQGEPASSVGYVLMPIVPTLEMLAILRDSEWPADWNAGKEMQRHVGSDIVPPECGMEVACGQYQRLLKLGKS